MASDYKQDLNNYSHQSIICGTYYVIVAQCLRNRGDNDSISLANRYDDLSTQAFKEGYETAKLVGLSEKAIAARSEIETLDQMGEIENDCINISVVNLKHGRSCRSFMEEREKTLNAIAAKMRSGNR